MSETINYFDPNLYAQPLWFLTAAAVLLGWVHAISRRRPTVRHSAAHAFEGIAPSLRQRLLWMPWLLRIAAIVLLAAAAARPQLRTGESRTATNGVAIQIVIDRSSSMGERMRLDDGVTDRLSVVKRVVREFVLGDAETFEGRPDDLIGLVTFAARPNTICPLTHDHAILADLADDAKLAASRREDGTAIGDAIALAAARLRDAEERLQRRASENPEERPEFTLNSRVIVLLTDGENTRGSLQPLEATRLAAEWGVKIYTVAVGSRGFLQRGPDRALLSAIAERTGGRFFDAQDADTLREVYAAIDELETTEITELQYDNVEELYEPLARWGLATLGAHIFVSAAFFRRARP
ncbi:MAG: VWA domain-containing protein [Planctomycetota bacterium]